LSSVKTDLDSDVMSENASASDEVLEKNVSDNKMDHSTMSTVNEEFLDADSADDEFVDGKGDDEFVFVDGKGGDDREDNFNNAESDVKNFSDSNSTVSDSTITERDVEHGSANGSVTNVVQNEMDSATGFQNDSVLERNNNNSSSNLDPLLDNEGADETDSKQILIEKNGKFEVADLDHVDPTLDRSQKVGETDRSEKTDERDLTAKTGEPKQTEKTVESRKSSSSERENKLKENIATDESKLAEDESESETESEKRKDFETWVAEKKKVAAEKKKNEKEMLKKEKEEEREMRFKDWKSRHAQTIWKILEEKRQKKAEEIYKENVQKSNSRQRFNSPSKSLGGTPRSRQQFTREPLTPRNTSAQKKSKKEQEHFESSLNDEVKNNEQTGRDAAVGSKMSSYSVEKENKREVPLLISLVNTEVRDGIQTETNNL